MSWGWQGLITSIQNYLGVPMGATYRPASSKDNETSGDNSLKEMDLIKSIVSITVDDVCIGSSPFYYKTGEPVDNAARSKFDKILRELNSIAKWIAYDLLVDGISPYKIKVVGKEIYIYPILDKVKVILNSRKEIILLDENDSKIIDALVFVNFDRTSLAKIEGKNYEFSITPKSIQLSNVTETGKELAMVEKAILRYRRDLSKILRFVSVEVGASQGNKQQELLDNVSSGINANSLSLETTVSDLFDDEIPVFPTRKGLGKPEIEEHVPSANISELADLDHVLGKLFLGMKFPKTYADFTQALGATAVSMIRGDIRYSRMLKTARTLMEKTVNAYFSDLKQARQFKLEFKLQEIPNPEDQEVIESLQSYSDFIENSYENIINSSETEDEALYKLQTYVDLLGDSSNLRSIERWIQTTRKYIKKKFNSAEADLKDEEFPEDFDESGETAGEEMDDIINENELGGPILPEEEAPESERTEEVEEEGGGEYAPNERPPQF